MSKTKESDNRLGVVGIILNSPEQDFAKVNEILHDFSSIIVGRMGIPYREKKIAVIALTIDGTMDDIGAMTGRLGQLAEVMVKTAIAPKSNL